MKILRETEERLPDEVLVPMYNIAQEKSVHTHWIRISHIARPRGPSSIPALRISCHVPP